MENENIQRLRYSKGQLLTAKDFEDQQSYHREKLDRFIERFPHGIVTGLKVICSAADSARYGRLRSISNTRRLGDQ